MGLSHSVTEVLFVTLNNVCFHFWFQMLSIKLTLWVYIYLELIVYLHYYFILSDDHTLNN